MIYGYARVSTKTQENEGNSLESQERLLIENGAQEIFKDGFTGTKMQRPELDKLLSKIKEGDTLVVCKLDRIARSLSHGSALITNLIEKGVKVNILNIGVMDSTPSSKLIKHIFFAFAEFERDMIVERTSEGRAIARTKEFYKDGRPKKFTQHQIDYALSLLGAHTYKEIEKMTRISKSTLIRAKRKKIIQEEE